jgi:hypothetical protein
MNTLTASSIASDFQTEKTRLSLYYPVCYLLFGGLALLLMPHFSMSLMFSNGDYGDIFPRYIGTMSLGLGILVLQIVRHRVAALYTTLIWVRVVFCACYIYFYQQSADPFFLTMLGMVGLGAVATSVAWLNRPHRRT